MGTSARTTLILSIGFAALAPPASAQEAVPLVEMRNDSVSIRFVDAELAAAVQALARYLDRPLAFGTLEAGKVTLETPTPVHRSEIPALLSSILESHRLELVADSAVYTIHALDAPAERAGTTGGPGARRPPTRLWVVRLKHARAEEVAATVNALYGRASALGELGARPATLGDELAGQQLPPLGAPDTHVDAAVLSTRPAELTGEVTIVPDAATNSLLIRATDADFELISAAIQEVDLRPLQVLIEVLIAEVRRDRSFAFGVSASLDTTANPVEGIGSIVGSTAGLGLGDFVVHVMNIGGLELDATLRAAAGRGDVTILSRPVVLAANNETARILVGSQRPFVQVSRSLPTDVATRDQVVQYRDVGTELTVHPTITGDGYVMLDVTQEVNAATSETAFDAPVISTRSLVTRLLVRDGQTVVLGGLTDHQRDRRKEGIPVLSQIPLIGGLFGLSSRRATETELMLFITPTVIRSDQDAEDLTAPLRESVPEGGA